MTVSAADILTATVRLAEAGRPCVLCTVLVRRGSTPQQAGARMLVLPTGATVGTVGGGCVEAEVRSRALAMLASPDGPAGSGVRTVFRLDHDYGWDDGLICGGALTVLFEPVRRPADADLWRRVEAGLRGVAAESPSPSSPANEGAAPITCGHVPAGAGTDSASERQPAAIPPRTPDRVLWTRLTPQAGDRVAIERALLPTDALPPAEFGLSAAEGEALRARALRTRSAVGGRPAETTGDHPPGARLPRGGEDAHQGLAPAPAPEVYAEPVPAPHRLFIAGAGHVGQALAGLAVRLDFATWVLDDREVVLTLERFPAPVRRRIGDIADGLAGVDWGPADAAVIVTRGHRHDGQALRAVVGRPAGYVGMIGSRRKVALIFEELRAAGVAEDRLSRVHAPIGLDIGARTVEEIALSIAAQLVAFRAGGTPHRPAR